MTEKELKHIRARVYDLRSFWSGWGFDDVADMPQYMQDLIKLLEYVDELEKEKIIRERGLPEPSDNFINTEIGTEQSIGRVADTGASRTAD